MVTLRHRITANSGTSTMTRIRTFLLTAMSRPILRRATGLFLFLGFPGLAFIDQSCVAVRLSQSEVHVAIYSFFSGRGQFVFQCNPVFTCLRVLSPSGPHGFLQTVNSCCSRNSLRSLLHNFDCWFAFFHFIVSY